MNQRNDTIAQRLRLARKTKKLTQEELAEKCGISRQTIYEYERGEYIPKLDNAGKLCRALGIDLEYLCFGYTKEKDASYLLTYKDLMRSYLLLQDSYLFTSTIKDIENGEKEMTIRTTDPYFIKVCTQIDSIRAASDSLNRETYDNAINDILSSFDIAILKKDE